jgi:hypothetical protein
MKNMKLKLERGLEFFFKKIEANYHSSLSYVFCIFPLLFMLKGTCTTLQFVHPTTKKLFNLVQE